MKVLLINGSPKENGNTFTALSEVAKTLNSEGVDTEIISIGKQAVQGCIACGMCGRNGGGRCTFHDDLYYRVWRCVKDGIYYIQSIRSSCNSRPYKWRYSLQLSTR